MTSSRAQFIWWGRPGGRPSLECRSKSGLEEESSVIRETSIFSLRSARAGGRADGNSARLVFRGKWNIPPL
ncbi:hypothetical protein CEXT_388081 [Caerostris extrusa]|uniref:Uncharacterized protein n=1 Tax=Caerostris extrusa TaxID=172846 RepID=A0AAV4R9H8_CAEEX|nr:hypothetical protein CEXT_388081 [Caerostris extrusa]